MPRHIIETVSSMSVNVTRMLGVRSIRSRAPASKSYVSEMAAVPFLTNIMKKPLVNSAVPLSISAAVMVWQYISFELLCAASMASKVDFCIVCVALSAKLHIGFVFD